MRWRNDPIRAGFALKGQAVSFHTTHRETIMTRLRIPALVVLPCLIWTLAPAVGHAGFTDALKKKLTDKATKKATQAVDKASGAPAAPPEAGAAPATEPEAAKAGAAA